MKFDPEMFLRNEGDGKTVSLHQPGSIIFEQGALAEEVFYLRLGQASETVRSETGKIAVVGMIEKDSFFGCSSLEGGKHRFSTVTAVTPCTVTAISVLAMRRALHHPQFSHLFMSYLLDHNGRIEADKVDLLFNSSEKRLAQKLLILAHVGDGQPTIIGPEITQEMLADMVGTTRPRINMFLNRFRKLDLVQYDRRGITVLPALLQAVLQEIPTVRKR